MVVLFLLSVSKLGAQQPCISNPTATANLEVNGVRALVSNGGDLWYDGNEGRYVVTAEESSPNGNQITAMLMGGLLLSARDTAGIIIGSH